jgi:hypothetical protein
LIESAYELVYRLDSADDFFSGCFHFGCRMFDVSYGSIVPK